MSVNSGGGQIILPVGATIGAGSETAQIDSNGQLTQGMVFPVKLSGGTSTSVFVPNSMIGNIPAIQALFDQRLQGIAAITGE